MMRVLVMIVLLLIYNSICVDAQKKPGSRRPHPPVSIEETGRIPYQIEISTAGSYPQEIVLGVGAATVFHLPEPAFQVIFGNKEGIAYAEPNEESARNDIYVRAAVPKIRTNMILEFRTGTLILNVRTVDKKGGVRSGDYHGEVYVKPQAINRLDNRREANPAPVQKQPDQQKETKEPNQKVESSDRQVADLQEELKKSQVALARAQGELVEERKKVAALTESMRSREQNSESGKLRARIEILEKALKEKESALKNSKNEIAHLEKKVGELKASLEANKKGAKASTSEAGKLKKDVARLEMELSKSGRDLIAANLKILRLGGELENRSMVADLDSAAEPGSPGGSLPASLIALESLLKHSKPLVKRERKDNGVRFGQFGNIAVDELGRFWIGVYLMNSGTSDLSLLSIQDPDNKSAMVKWPGRFAGKNSATLRGLEEAYFFVVMQPQGKEDGPPSELELTFSPKRKLKIDVK